MFEIAFKWSQSSFDEFFSLIISIWIVYCFSISQDCLRNSKHSWNLFCCQMSLIDEFHISWCQCDCFDVFHSSSNKCFVLIVASFELCFKLVFRILHFFCWKIIIKKKHCWRNRRILIEWIVCFHRFKVWKRIIHTSVQYSHSITFWIHWIFSFEESKFIWLECFCDSLTVHCEILNHSKCVNCLWNYSRIKNVESDCCSSFILDWYDVKFSRKHIVSIQIFLSFQKSRCFEQIKHFICDDVVFNRLSLIIFKIDSVSWNSICNLLNRLTNISIVFIQHIICIDINWIVVFQKRSKALKIASRKRFRLNSESFCNYAFDFFCESHSRVLWYKFDIVHYNQQLWMHKIFQKKASLHLLLFLFVDFEINCRNILHINFDDVKAIWQNDFLWQFVFISTFLFRFCKQINIEIVCFNNLHEFVLHFVRILHAFTQSIQTACKIVELFINLEVLFKMSVFFTFECEFINFCVSSFWHLSYNKE